ncbi:MAG: acyl carrier protein [Anaerolineales bacterium]|nr:acyl carrier protein [Anaerolineales bacterium]MBP6209555.1 acyl carrier protein [Anaerolineales bacterium]
MTTEIVNTIAKQIAEKILKQPSRVIGADEPLISSGLIDSFSLVDLALFVEDTFGVRIEDSELNAATFDSLSQLAELIRSRQS